MSDGCGCQNVCGCNHAEEVEYPEVTVYQSAEQIPSFSNMAHKAESKFDKLSDKIAKQYEKKGMSPKEAKEIGAKTAYTIGRRKYGKAGMARKARAGMRAESFEAEEWDFGDDREALRKGDEHSDFNNAWRWIFKTKRREWPKWGQKFYDKYKWTLDDPHWNPQLDAESFGADENHTNKDYKNMQKDLNKFVNTFCKCKHSKGAPSALNIYTSCGYCGKEIDEVSFYGLTKDAESFETEGGEEPETITHVIVLNEGESGNSIRKKIRNAFDKVGYQISPVPKKLKGLTYLGSNSNPVETFIYNEHINKFRNALEEQELSPLFTEVFNSYWDIPDEKIKHYNKVGYPAPYSSDIEYINEYHDAESFEAQGNPDKRTTTQYANFYVGWEDEEGELRGGGKFKKFNDAKAQAEIVAERNGNSRVVEKRGFALWTDDGKGMWQEGYDKADAKKFYSAEDAISIAQGWRLGLGMGLGLMTLSALTTLVAFGLTKRDEGQE
ncbi:MAG: hypothetical protein HOC18_10860 [Candidatus Marinimicrobia bacterium]|jgi:hypothetical protein|nr:hypothetical protein [Candidatus Neomarinimicrobiota bacterium]